MNFKAFLLLGTSISAALISKEQNQTVAMSLADINNQDTNITIEPQQVNCNAVKEIIIMADLTGLSDAAWENSAMPTILKLVRSFDVSATAARFELFSRSSSAYNGYWCINVELYYSDNNNINSLVSRIQAMPCNVLSPIGISTLVGVLYGSRRANIPVEILILTDWLLHNSGLPLYEVDRIKAFSGVRFVCAGVGSAVDYGYLGSICGNNIIKIANYGAMINAVDQIANNLCNGVNTPTVPAPTVAPTRIPTLAPTAKVTPAPSSKAPTATPTVPPTVKPTLAPTFIPSKSPTKMPTHYPTTAPRTKYPTRRPTNYPTKRPTTNYPTKAPRTTSPTTAKPTLRPTAKRLRNLVT